LEEVATCEAGCVAGCASQIREPLDKREGPEEGLALVLETEAVSFDVGLASRVHDVLREGGRLVAECDGEFREGDEDTELLSKPFNGITSMSMCR
jgi:hypothetical protein